MSRIAHANNIGCRCRCEYNCVIAVSCFRCATYRRCFTWRVRYDRTPTIGGSPLYLHPSTYSHTYIPIDPNWVIVGHLRHIILKMDVHTISISQNSRCCGGTEALTFRISFAWNNAYVCVFGDRTIFCRLLETQESIPHDLAVRMACNMADTACVRRGSGWLRMGWWSFYVRHLETVMCVCMQNRR